MQPPNGNNQTNGNNQMQPPNGNNQMQPPNENMNQNFNGGPNASGNAPQGSNGMGGPNNGFENSSTSKEFTLTSIVTTFINVGKYVENTNNTQSNSNSGVKNGFLSAQNKATSDTSYAVQNGEYWISKKSLLMFTILSLIIFFL